LDAHISRPGTYQGDLRLQTQVAEVEQTFTILRLGSGAQSVAVHDTSAEGGEPWVVENGHTRWEFAPGFSAAAVGWYEMKPAIRGGGAVNQLMTSFPDAGELGWIKPWFGGVRPFLHDPSKRGGWPGSLHKETFTASRHAQPDRTGLVWEGVRMAASMTQDPFQGLRMEVDYLTVGGSNVLKTVIRLVNETPAYFQAQPGLMAFFQVDGTHQNGVIHNDAYQHRRTAISSWGLAGSWGAVENPETGRAAVLVQSSGWQRVQSVDWGLPGAHFNSYETLEVPPHKAVEIVTYLALAESLAVTSCTDIPVGRAR
jgi:hypothetical protein